MVLRSLLLKLCLTCLNSSPQFPRLLPPAQSTRPDWDLNPKAGPATGAIWAT